MTETVEELAVDLGESVACEWPECGDEAAWRTRVRCECDHAYYRLICRGHAPVVRLAVQRRVLYCSPCGSASGTAFTRLKTLPPGGHRCVVEIIGEVPL